MSSGNYSHAKKLPSRDDFERMVQLENEQEELNASLLALTTHFAQVQFRLQQIGQASSGDKERLLAELEQVTQIAQLANIHQTLYQFAFRGCPDVLSVVRMERRGSRNRRLSSALRNSDDVDVDGTGIDWVITYNHMHRRYVHRM
jgi:hypothetical protein